MGEGCLRPQSPGISNLYGSNRIVKILRLLVQFSLVLKALDHNVSRFNESCCRVALLQRAFP